MVAQKHRVLSLFSGIGGIELGLGAAGHQIALFVERDESARRVLARNFAGVALHDDVTTLQGIPDGTTLVTAGFPCQDVSQAGRVEGLEGDRSSLVRHVFRLLEEHRTPWVFLENVAFLLRAKRGNVLASILERLEQLGYRWAYRVVDSESFGVPQRRERVYIVAALDADPRGVLLNQDASPPRRPASRAVGFYWSEGNKGLGWARDAVPPLKSGSSNGGSIPPAIVLPNGVVVKPDIRDAERLQGFEPDWTIDARSERERWRLVGNAVTVPVAEWLGRRLKDVPTFRVRRAFELQVGSVWPGAAFNVDGKRYGLRLSPHPVWIEREPLHKFLKYGGVELSPRATSGFLSRARASTLNLPHGFLDKIEAHLERVTAEPVLAFPGGRGTANMIQQAEQAQVAVTRVGVP
jgi:DNA (cytosine-5)-methyltransferase 1